MSSVRKADRRVDRWLRYSNRYPATCETLSTAFSTAVWRQSQAWAHRFRKNRSPELKQAERFWADRRMWR